MNTLQKYELSQILGGGYWWLDSAGIWHYNPDDEESDGDDVVIG